MSPGWHFKNVQILASVENRIARAFPVLRMDKLVKEIPTASDSSVKVFLRLANITSRWVMIFIVIIQLNPDPL